MKPQNRIFFFVLVISGLVLVSLACRTLVPAATPTPAQPIAATVPVIPVPTSEVTTATVELEGVPIPPSQGPFQITGVFTYSNSIITTYYVEQEVALVDMHGFIIRDQEWEIPIASQTLGFLQIDPEQKKGSYILQLPVRPTGLLDDVDNNGKKDTGIQVFAVSYWPNLTGGPYSEGDDPSRGWPSYLASVKTDTENKDEVIGGNLVVWAPDNRQEFPTGFGTDHLLFTADDPVGTLPAGYSIVNLDREPFTVSQDPQPVLPLFEPKDVAIKDFSNLSYTEAFDSMFEKVKKEYAFNGIQGKPPDWDALYKEIKPRIEQAEKDKDAKAFYLALRDFTWAFKDGHVGLDGGDIQNAIFSEDTSGGYGFAIRELDDGHVVVIYILEGGPADKAGMKVGAEVTEFNSKPIKEAIAAVKPWTLPHSSDFSLRYQQARYLLRTLPGTKADVAFTNPGGQTKKATLTAIQETESYRRTSLYYGVDTSPLVPLEFKVLDSGVGYIKITSNFDDLNLIVRLFQRALQTFQSLKVPGVIIDMRYNSGGAPLGLAGFLTDKEILMGQLEYYSDKTGKFEPEGPREKVYPNVEQYRFDKLVLLVGQACYSACEIESYGFSQVPDMIVVGQYPTAGVEAEVARGQYKLPEGFSLQVPTGRFTLPDGSLFLEGVGVVPTLRVPIDETTVFSEEDVVLKAGEQAALQPTGAGVKPSTNPKLVEASQIQDLINSGKLVTLEERAREQYTTEELQQMGQTFTYTISLAKSETLAWIWGWCAKDQATLKDNLSKLDPKFSLNGTPVSTDNFLQLDYDSSDGQKCRAYIAVLQDWKGGENHAVTTVTFKASLNDGKYVFQPGKQIFDYAVYVKP